MGTEYMAQNVADFLRDLNKIQTDLDGFSRNLDARSREVVKLLEAFEQQGAEFAAKLDTGNDMQNGVDLALQANLSAKNTALKEWRDKVEEDRKGREFMHKHEKYLVVMVFGAVKAGKSTLGNFFGGREFRHAEFDNVYKHLPLPIFITEEDGRATESLAQDENGETWFKEGVVDTTGSIQYFTLSGLRWMDSPGTGALGKQGDTRSMDEMVDEYIPYADMCIFLMNSGQPGLQKDMRYMAKLSREGQDAIIVITRSDTVEEDVDDSGNIIRIRIPKSAETRRKQEDDICSRVLAVYPTVREEQCRAISVSSLLARQGIEKKDEQAYRDSNLDKLMQILGKKASGDAAKLKEKRPRRTFNAFVNQVLGQGDSETDCVSVTALQKNLTEVTAAIAESQKAMADATRLLVLDIKNETRREFLQAARSWEKSVMQSGTTLDGQELSRRVSNILHKVMQRKINEAISKIITDYEAKELHEAKLVLNTKGLQRQTDTIVHEYTTVDYVERDAEGFIENVRSFFGKKYYRRVTESHTERRSIDLGTNIEDVIDDLLPQIEQQVKPYVQHEMQYLRESYFKPQENYVNVMSKALKQLLEGLEKLKFAE